MGRLAKLLVGAAVGLVVVGGALWWFVVRDTSPPPPELSDVDPTGRTAEPGALDATWALVPSATGGSDPEYYVGYLISELFGGDTFERDAVARTALVEGELVISGDEVTSVTVTADLTGLVSEDPTAGRRDNYVRSNALETDDFPDATFTLTEPVDLAPLPAEGVATDFELVGDLTLHGETREVVVTVEAQWEGDTVEVVGSAPIVLADFAITPPDIPGLATADDEGAFEVRLLFERT
jgi:polyisoprenoid-binding protein YceI